MKLAFAVTKYFPYGGMQRNLLRMARTAAARGHAVTIFTSDWEGPRPEGIDVELLRVRFSSNHGRNELFGRALLTATRDGAFDCVVGSSLLPGLDVYYAGGACFAIRFLAERPLLRFLPRYHYLLRQERRVFGPGSAAEILLVAPGEKERFIQQYGTDADRFHLLPPGIDRDRLLAERPNDEQRQALRRQLGLSPTGTLILSVGSSFNTKGIDRAIRAVASLPAPVRHRCRLVVVGRGDRRPYERLAKRLGVTAELVFTGPRADVPRFYAAADLLLHPAYVENTGNVLLEAMLFGRPVLATAVCGFAPHVERADAGIVVPEPYEQSALDEALASMIDSDRRDEWQANAERYCAEHDLYSMIDRAVDVIEACATRRAAERTAAGSVAAVAG